MFMGVSHGKLCVSSNEIQGPLTTISGFTGNILARIWEAVGYQWLLWAWLLGAQCGQHHK